MYDTYPVALFGDTFPGQGNLEFQFLVNPKTLHLDILGDHKIWALRGFIDINRGSAIIIVIKPLKVIDDLICY